MHCSRHSRRSPRGSPLKERTPAPQPCPFCHGAGQTSSFMGVSRFLLTTEECRACGGTGLKLDNELEAAQPLPPKKRRYKTTG